MSSSEDDDCYDDDFDRLVSRIASHKPFVGGAVLYRGQIRVNDAARLAEALRGNSTIIDLVLVDCSLGDEGVALLATLFHTKSSLTALHLSNNKVGVKGSRALAEALPFSSSLALLDLSRNCIGDEGARALAAALPFNSSVAALFLGNNRIGPAGATALAEGLLDNSSLAQLRLGWNGIGGGGARAFVGLLLRGNSTLNYIELHGTGISQELVRMVEELLEMNHNAARAALGGKISWLSSLRDDGARLLPLGFERGPGEAERIRVETRIGWLVNSEDGAGDQAALYHALAELGCFPRADQRQRLLGQLLGSPKHGVRIASSVGEVGGRALYRKAAECSAGLNVLMNLLRAHPSLCACRDIKTKLYPFMVLATMSEAGVEEVIELLLQSPSLVQSGIGRPAECGGPVNSS